MMIPKNHFTKTAQDTFVTEGIFCDCYGTLFGMGYVDDADLVEYLNALHAAQKKVVLFSSNPEDVRKKVLTLGLHPDLTRRIMDKRCFSGELLECVIDDDMPGYLRAKTLHDPRDAAFRRKMIGEIAVMQQSAAQQVPPAPAAP